MQPPLLADNHKSRLPHQACWRRPETLRGVSIHECKRNEAEKSRCIQRSLAVVQSNGYTKISFFFADRCGSEKSADNAINVESNEKFLFPRPLRDDMENILRYELTEELRRPQADGPQAHILIVEDDPQIQKVLQRMFHDQGYPVTTCGDGQAGLNAFRAVRPAAVMLDLILPNIVGRELCKTMKSEQPEIPVIVVSGVSEVVDKVLLLEFGADDYVTKPFSPRELMARVEGAIRRRQRPAHAISKYSFGECEIDFAKMTARRAGKPVAVTAHEFKLLKYFVDNAERVLSREELLSQVWGYNSYPTTRTVDNQILKLRQKLEPDSTEPRYLHTIYGAGYKFIP
jgi:DNA-binding response OmpR family regulator